MVSVMPEHGLVRMTFRMSYLEVTHLSVNLNRFLLTYFVTTELNFRKSMLSFHLRTSASLNESILTGMTGSIKPCEAVLFTSGRQHLLAFSS